MKWLLVGLGVLFALGVLGAMFGEDEPTAVRTEATPRPTSFVVPTTATSARAPTSTTAKFSQTWPKRYDSTTCDEWARAMTADQRRVAAADMLVSVRKVDGGDSLPSDRLIQSFADDITEGCEPTPQYPITDTATAVYLIGKDQYGP